ncbi:MAG TPA: ester cyclase [Candidatus Acidoferrum sp.]|nr:ester cyclase [Candidatus Acidoferrum sp.]
MAEGTEAEQERAMPTDNKSIVRRMYEEVWNKRNLEVAKELIAPSHAVQLFDAADSGVGPEAYASNVVQFVRAFPDLKFTILDMVAENEKVVAFWNISGTHKGEFRGIAPTGKKVSVDGITMIQLSDGKIMDSYVSLDMWSMMQQLGALPAVRQPQRASAR